MDPIAERVCERLGLDPNAELTDADVLSAVLDRIEAIERRLGPEHTCRVIGHVHSATLPCPPSQISVDEEQRMWERNEPILIGQD